MNRDENLLRLKSEVFDICVIGAGASGAGVALDATLRGFKVALIDKTDFCAETSSRSTKLIHGGVRYLEQAFKKLDLAQLKQVKHGLHERRTLLTIAPHLAKPQALITPVFSWAEGFYYFLGLKLYNYFSRHDGLPVPRWLNKSKSVARIPGLNQNIHSTVLYYDGTFNDSRFCLAMVQKANELGAAVANYTELSSFHKDEMGKIQAGEIRDRLADEKIKVRAKLFINCTGPYADAVRLMAEPDEELRMRPAKGVHISFSADFLQSDDALLIPETKDGRVVFVKPLENLVMAGTTDTAYNTLEEEPVLEQDEVDYLLETLRPFLNETPERHEIKAGFAGIRPLLAAKSSKRKETKSLLRDHEVEYLETSGLLNLLGGKWTTYRVMAKDAVDEASRILGKETNCNTQNQLLFGAENLDEAKEEFFEKLGKRKLGLDTIHQLLESYGSKSVKLIDLAIADTALFEKIHPDYPYIMVEVIYGIREEMVSKFRDFLSRRVRLEILDWKASLEAMEKIAPIFARELKWSESKLKAEKQDYHNLIALFCQKAKISEHNLK